MRTAAPICALAILVCGACILPSPLPAQESRPDLVLITVDTLRADALGFAGNEAVETPVLDRLAARGRVFTDAHAHNVITLPSHANILTGLYPYQHGVRDNGGFRLDASTPTMASVLRQAGYATGAFVAAFPLTSQFGLDGGFDVYDDRGLASSHSTEIVLPERPGDEVVAAALEWWDGARDGPRFLWVHLFEPHAPYAPPEPFAERYRDAPYLGEVAAVDAFLAPLLGPFLDGGEPPALIAFTSDHGEALGDHGELTHGLFAYEATLKVPLVLWGKGVTPGRDARPARHVDLMPTMLAAAGLEAAGLPGRALLESRKGSFPSYFEALSANLNRGWAPLRGVIKDRRKWIALPLPELYDLTRDAAEVENLVERDPATARALLALLPEESIWPPPRGRLTDEAVARLESLGYLAGDAEPQKAYGPDDDPKRLIELDRMLHGVIERLSLGRPTPAALLAREVVARRPSMALGRSLLAQALLDAGATGEALAVMRQARADGVTTATLLRQLGLSLIEAGHLGEAESVLTPMLAADPDSAKTEELLGLLELRRQRWAAARDRCRRALELDDRLPLAWNHLGVALYRLDDPEGALDAWRRAVDLDPELWDALYNLGIKALEHGRDEAAREALRRFVADAPKERYADDMRRARVLLRRLERRSGAGAPP